MCSLSRTMVGVGCMVGKRVMGGRIWVVQVCGSLCGFFMEIRVKRVNRVTQEYTCDLGISNT
jgi:hypothetical protein